MDYNLAGIRNRILVDKLDDDEFDPDVVDNFINDTQRDIFNQFGLTFMEKIFQGTIPAGTTIFKFPDDVAEIQAQVITSPSGQQHNLHDSYLPFRQFFTRYPNPGAGTAGRITNWTLYSGNMLTNVPTDQAYTMTIFYIKKATTLKLNSDVPDLPEEFAELLILGTLERIQIRNEDYDLAEQTHSQYERVILQLVNRYGERIADGPIKMQNSQV